MDKRIFVEKKADFRVKSDSLVKEFSDPRALIPGLPWLVAEILMTPTDFLIQMHKLAGLLNLHTVLDNLQELTPTE